MLNKVNIQIRYNSSEHNMINDFYNPCLRACSTYYRAVGYFTSYGLSLASQGIASLINNDGCMRLIASPHLQEDDIIAINLGYESKENILHRVFERELDNIEEFVVKKRLEALSWMIEEGLLEIKIAFKGKASIQAGLFHEKMGVFIDGQGNRVAFSGSGNETFGGWGGNYEALSTYCSWKDTRSYVEEIERNFESLWSNIHPKLTILDYTAVARDVLRPYRPLIRPVCDPIENEESDEDVIPADPVQIKIPSGITLRDYQKAAIKNWFSSGGRGVFKMATGAGKTITALALAENLYQVEKSNCFVVIAPYIHLVRQWSKEATSFGFRAIAVHGSYRNWLPKLEEGLSQVGNNRPLFIVITNRGFQGKEFQKIACGLPESALLIADEVHNLGTTGLFEALPGHIQFRLGLSATPERHLDDDGTSRILEYFGDILKPEYSLKQALDSEVLCPYEYNLVKVDLTDEEDEEFHRLSLAIARSCNSKSETTTDSSSELCKRLLIKRARLVANAYNKLSALSDIVSNYKNESHILVYCGSGQSDDLKDEKTRRHIDKVCDCLGNKMGMRIATFTHKTELENRDELLEKLDRGDLQCLAAIRCLDEGVDVPSIRIAFIMASTSNPRQYIQRRGRLLRRYPGKDKAIIYDFIVLPSLPSCGDSAISSLVRREWRRAHEFAKLSLNSGDVCCQIIDWGLEYGVNVFDDLSEGI